MIVQRLVEYAIQKHLLDEMAFDVQPIAFVLQLKQDGNLLGIDDRRPREELPAKKAGAAPKIRIGKGQDLPVPKPHGNKANKGFAVYFADTLERVLPITEEEKFVASRRTFWAQIDRAAEETGDPGLRAVQAFGRRAATDPQLAADVKARLEQLKPGPGDRCTFAFGPDGEQIPSILHRPAIQDWYRAFFSACSAEQATASARGLCQVRKTVGPLPGAHATKVKLPGGLPTGVSLISNDKPAFESYALEGAVNAAIGFDAAEGYTRALARLIADRQSCLAFGDVRFLYWTKQEEAFDWGGTVNQPTPEEVEKLVKAVQRGQADHELEPRDFYCLALSANAARIIVRDYLEAPLSEIKENLGRWFADLRIIDPFQGHIRANFPLFLLVNATARTGDEVAPDTAPSLVRACLKNLPLPDHILAACLQRLKVEGSKAFQPYRLALVKLILIRGGTSMSEVLKGDNRDQAYVCGRLLAMFENIQSAAMKGLNATVVDKYYGTFSTAPGLLLARLFANAQNHLRKLRGEPDKGGLAHYLDKRLGEIASLLHPQGVKGLFSLQEQGRFALGFYHEKFKHKKRDDGTTDDNEPQLD